MGPVGEMMGHARLVLSLRVLTFLAWRQCFYSHGASLFRTCVPLPGLKAGSCSDGFRLMPFAHSRNCASFGPSAKFSPGHHFRCRSWSHSGPGCFRWPNMFGTHL